MSAAAPPAAWRKYALLLSVALQDALQYRIESFIWFLFDVLPPLMMVFVWLAAYRETDQVGGYSLGAKLGYYLGLALLRNVITPHPEWEIAESIRNGRLSILLLKPVSAWLYWLIGDAASRLFRLVLVGPVLLAATLLLGDRATPPRVDPEALLALALALPLAYALSFFLKLSHGFAGFWLLDINGLAGLFEVAVFLFGGTIVPLELMPPWLRAVADALPFEYIYYFPLAIVLGRLHGADLWGRLAVQAGWTVIAFLLAGLLWRRGLRRYEAVGA
jgi:ABC-2 type transport system permease protein